MGSSQSLHPTRRIVEEGLAGKWGESGRQFAHDAVPLIGDEYADAEGNAMSYVGYLQTEEWQEYRAAVLARNGGKCATCPRDSTHCHHRTYEHLGWEDDDDCVGLCADCHAKLHPNGRAAVRRPRRAAA